MSERITGNSDLTKLEIQPGKFPSTPRPSDMTSFPVKGSAFSCVTKNAAVPAGKDLFPGNSRNWSERWNFLSLIDIEGIRSLSSLWFSSLEQEREGNWYRSGDKPQFFKISKDSIW